LRQKKKLKLESTWKDVFPISKENPHLYNEKKKLEYKTYIILKFSWIITKCSSSIPNRIHPCRWDEHEEKR